MAMRQRVSSLYFMQMRFNEETFFIAIFVSLNNKFYATNTYMHTYVYTHIAYLQTFVYNEFGLKLATTVLPTDCLRILWFHLFCLH